MFEPFLQGKLLRTRSTQSQRNIGISLQSHKSAWKWQRKQKCRQQIISSTLDSDLTVHILIFWHYSQGEATLGHAAPAQGGRSSLKLLARNFFSYNFYSNLHLLKFLFSFTFFM